MKSLSLRSKDRTNDTSTFTLGHPLYSDDLSDEEMFELQKKLRAEKDTRTGLTTLYTGTPGNWKRQELPERIAKTSPPYA